MSTDEGDIVLDPFNGTGTTAIAAKRLGRQYIGFELDENYVEITNSKLAQEQSDSKLGDYWVSFFLDEIVSLRDKDWDDLKNYYAIPNRIEEIDITPIVLQARKKIRTPLNSIIIANGNGNGHLHKQDVLFEPRTEYKEE